MRLDSSLNIALNEQGCLRYPGPKTGYGHPLGLRGGHSAAPAVPRGALRFARHFVGVGI